MPQSVGQLYPKGPFPTPETDPWASQEDGHGSPAEREPAHLSKLVSLWAVDFGVANRHDGP